MDFLSDWITTLNKWQRSKNRKGKERNENRRIHKADQRLVSRSRGEKKRTDHRPEGKKGRCRKENRKAANGKEESRGLIRRRKGHRY